MRFFPPFFPSLPLAIDCGTLSNPANGTVQLASTTLGSAARYNCNLGFELNGTEVRICLESGKWSDEAPVCNRE